MARRPRSRKPVPLDVIIARAIRHLRQKRGWSQQALAARLGITVEHLRGLEKATRPMRPRMLIRLASVLEAPLSAFFRNYGRRPPLGAIAVSPVTYDRDPFGAAAPRASTP
jgi:transcriptional regulator with XRE-family HTH domain